MSGRQLARYVDLVVDGTVYELAPGDVPPPEVAAHITAPGAWVGGGDEVVSEAPVSDTTSTTPPDDGPATVDETPEPVQDPDPVPDGDTFSVDPTPGPEGDDSVTVERPRRNGGRAAWASYADSIGVAVADAMSRDEIIAAVDAAEGAAG